MGLRIYIDPETLRQKNDLKFRPESYSVEPTGSVGIRDDLNDDPLNLEDNNNCL